jgi:hypothetical protein
MKPHTVHDVGKSDADEQQSQQSQRTNRNREPTNNQTQSSHSFRAYHCEYTKSNMTSNGKTATWPPGERIYKYNEKIIGLTFLTLTPGYREFAKNKIREYVKKRGLDMDGEMVRVSRTTNGAKTCTLTEYHGRYAELFNFACVTGDWRTATLFCRNEETKDDPDFCLCPADPEPAVPETVAKFMLWKTCEKDKNVMYRVKRC